MGKIIKSGIEYAGGGGGGGDVDKQYVDTQDAATLQSAKNYTDGKLIDKADKNTTYTKTETDALVSSKADASTTYTKTEVDEAISDAVDAIDVPTVVQAIGQSTTDVMSQKAVTDMVYIGDTKQNIAIGLSPTVSNLSGSNIVIGERAKSYGSRDVAIGYGAKASKEEGFASGGGIAIGSDSYSSNPSSLSIGLRAITKGFSNGIGSNVAIGMDAVADPANNSGNHGVVYSVALGAYSKPTRRGEINIGTGGRNMGFVDNYSATDYRVIGGVHDGVDDHDAVTVGQLNTAIAGISVPTVVQSTGDSTTDVMSQKAATKLIYAERSGTIDNKTIIIGSGATYGSEGAEGTLKIGIGNVVTVSGTNSVVIGNRAQSTLGNECVVIGTNSSTGSGNSNAVAIGSRSQTASNSVALGANSVASRGYEVSIGSRKQGEAFDRYLSCVKNGERLNDAATVAQGNKLMTSAPTTSSEGVLGQLWTDTTAMHTYQCTAIDTTDPDNPVYTWTQRW